MNTTLDAMTEAGTEVIAAYLAQRDLAFTRSDEGVFLASFEGERGIAVRVLLRAGGDAGPGLAVLATADQEVQRAQWGWALVAINTCNAALRVVKARLAVDNWTTAEAGRVVVEGWLPLAGDVSRETSFAFLDGAISSALAFWGEGRATPAGGEDI